MVKTKFRHASPGSPKEEITIGVYISDWMKEEVGEFFSFNYYDQCLHGCNFSWAGGVCNCPIGKPFISKGKFKIYHLCPCAADKPVKIPRWKALEIINDWNHNQSEESEKGQRPSRWVYFL